MTRTQQVFPWRVLACATLCAILTTCVCAQGALAAPQSAVVPQSNSIYWGAYLNGAPFDQGQIDSFEALAGKRMSIVHWGQPWIMGGSFQPFQTAQYAAVSARGAIPMVDWGAWEVSRGPDQPDFRLAVVASGKYDRYVRDWAHAAREWGRPLFLRFGWEMNGWWQFPWAEQINGNQWGDYVRAWRHVHDIFVDQGATNVTWVWCPNISSARTRSLDSLYPGDNYVDWTCMDGYNFGSDNGNKWQTFSEVFGGSPYNANHNTYAELLAIAPSKPIMIGETASAETGGSKAAWISDMLDKLPTSFPQIKAVLWFNWNGGDPSISWPISSSPAAHQAFSSGIAAPAYAANGFGAAPDVAPAPPAPPPSPGVTTQPAVQSNQVDALPPEPATPSDIEMPASDVLTAGLFDQSAAGMTDDDSGWPDSDQDSQN